MKRQVECDDRQPEQDQVEVVADGSPQKASRPATPAAPPHRTQPVTQGPALAAQDLVTGLPVPCQRFALRRRQQLEPGNDVLLLSQHQDLLTPTAVRGQVRRHDILQFPDHLHVPHEIRDVSRPIHHPQGRLLQELATLLP